MVEFRKIRFEEGVQYQEIQLWRVVGYDPVHHLLVVEDPDTKERVAFYTSTGALVPIAGKRINYEYIDPK